MADKDNDEQQEKTIAEDLVVTKYKMAGEIANRKFYNHTLVSCFQLFLTIAEARCATCNAV